MVYAFILSVYEVLEISIRNKLSAQLDPEQVKQLATLGGPPTHSTHDKMLRQSTESFSRLVDETNIR